MDQKFYRIEPPLVGRQKGQPWGKFFQPSEIWFDLTHRKTLKRKKKEIQLLTKKEVF